MAYELSGEVKREVMRLADGDVVTAAREKYQAARLRLLEVESDFAQAQAVLARAKSDSENAIAGTGSLSPIDAEKALEDAQRAVNVAVKMVEKASNIATEADSDIRDAQAISVRPVYLEGIRRRIVAGRKADQARALLAEAEADHAEGSAIMVFATNKLGRHPVDPVVWQHPVRTEAQERAIWSGNYGCIAWCEEAVKNLKA